MFEKIESNETYQQVLKDSFGGVLYNVANENKYNTAELQEIVSTYSKAELSAINWIMKGAFNFLHINYK